MKNDLTIYRLSGKRTGKTKYQGKSVKHEDIIDLSMADGYLNAVKEIVSSCVTRYALIALKETVLPLDIEKRVLNAINNADNQYGHRNWAIIGNTGVEMYSNEIVRCNFDSVVGAFVIPSSSSIPYLATYVDPNCILLDTEKLKSISSTFPSLVLEPKFATVCLVAEAYKNQMLSLIDSELFTYVTDNGRKSHQTINQQTIVLGRYWCNHFSNSKIITSFGDIKMESGSVNNKTTYLDYYDVASKAYLQREREVERNYTKTLNIGIRSTLSRIRKLKRLLHSISELTKSSENLEVKILLAVNNTDVKGFNKLKEDILNFSPNLDIDYFYLDTKSEIFPKVFTLKQIVKRIVNDDQNFVWFVDDDDYVIPEKFNIIVELLNSKTLFIGDSHVYQEEWVEDMESIRPRKTKFVKTYKGRNFHKNVTGMNHIPICSVIYPINSLVEILNEYKLSGGYREDYAILLLAQKTMEVRSYPFVIAGISFHGKNITKLKNKDTLNTSYTTFLSEIINKSYLPSTFNKFMEKSRQRENGLLTKIHEKNLEIIEFQKNEAENLIFEKKKLNKDIKLRENYLKSIINDLRIQNQQLNSRSWKIFFNLRLRVLRIVKIINRILSFAVFKKFFTLLNVYKSLGFDGLRVLFKYKLNKLEDYPVDKFVIEYLKWQKKKEPKSIIKKVSTDENLKFSIVMPVWNVSPELLKKAIQSVERQTYNNWELCIYDDASTNLLTKEFLNSIKDSSPRIKLKFGEKNLNISLATNEALKLATGEYVLFLDNDDSLAPHALNEIAHVIKNNPKTDVIYYDEDVMLMNDLRVKPILKPDWSPETLDSIMYLAHSTYRRTLVNKLGGMRAGFEGSQDYDLILRVREKTENIVHIPKILYHWRRIPGSTADVFEEKDYAKTAAVKALKESIKRRKLKVDLLSGLTAPSNRFKYKIQNRPLVSIIIPTKNMTNYLRDCITSIENNTKYKNYEIIIVNNQSDDKTTLRYLEKISDKYTVLDYNKEFNYSAINNFAVSHAKGEHVLLLNNDIKIINEDWLGSMLEFSQQKRIGAVGALLFFEDDTIQHAGCAVGIGGVAGHFYKYARMGDYQMNMSLDFPKIIHNVSAVTGASLMVKKKVYLQVGGLDEKFKVAFNDIDFCLKVHTAGYRNIYTPFAQLYHYESKTRGYEHLDPTQQLRFNNEVKYFKTKWKKFLNDGDPYYNANFTLKDELGGLNMK